MHQENDIEFTFVLPCLNEEKTLGFCLNEIAEYIKDSKITAQILVVDNNSTDNSVKIARENNADVVTCINRGYGNALRYGTLIAKGKYCIMGDCDGSYDFSHLDEFIEKVRSGNDLVVGNRFKGGIEKNAMSLSHKIGGKFLSVFANTFFHTKVKDYHCGLRAYNTERIRALNLSSVGMEYASEMIIKAKINEYKIVEIGTILRKDLRGSNSHLRTIRDGFRHLNLIISLAFNKKKYEVGSINEEMC